ncbi:MAG: DUF6600 domain-containing protein [Spartobacteria bacterium]
MNKARLRSVEQRHTINTMKRILFALAAVALLLPAAQTSKAADVSVDFFYDNLSGGDWIDVADYGYVWQPSVAVSNTSWRPYSDGYWAYTDVGYTWVSYEDFGWATYHYGRWSRLSDYGWVWVPGRDEDLEWGPAWVSWRTGGNHIGWAPLPPSNVRIYEGRGISGRVDIDFNIGPSYYNFVDVRYIGEPVLRERIVNVNQNVTFINQTTNVTNITYKNKTVYNYGPDINTLNASGGRQIQRLKIERQENADINAAAKAGALVKPQGDKLVIAAPQHIGKAQGAKAPRAIKTKVAKANIDNGWSGVTDPTVKTQMQEKMKTEVATQPQVGADAAAQATTSAAPAASPTASIPAAAVNSPAPVDSGKGNRKNKANAPTQQNAAIGATGAGAAAGTSTAASVAPAASGTDTAVEGRGRGRGKHADRIQGGADVKTGAEATSSSTGAPDTTSQPGGGKRNRRGFEQPQGAAVGAGQAQPGDASGDQGLGGKHKGRRMDQPAGGQAGQGAEAQGPGGPGGKIRGERGAVGPTGPTGAPDGQQVQGQGPGQGKREGGKKNKGDAAPDAVASPTP